MHHAAFDQYPHALVVQALPMLGIPMPDFHGRPEAAPVFKLAIVGGDGVVEIDIQSQQPARFFIAVGELAVFGRRPDIAFADKGMSEKPPSYQSSY